MRHRKNPTRPPSMKEEIRTHPAGRADPVARRHFPTRVLRLAGGYWNGVDKWRVRGGSLLLLVLTVAQVALAVWTKPNQAYLLELQGRCPDLDFASAISVSNQMGRVHSRFDKVTVLGRQSIKMPCFIGRILPLDVKAIKQAQRDMREAGTMPEDPKP